LYLFARSMTRRAQEGPNADRHTGRRGQVN
jgi:hypothetical protein